MKTICAQLKTFRLRPLYLSLIGCLLNSTVFAAEDLLSTIANGSTNKATEQCVSEVNINAEDDLDTGARLYQTGVCYFCVECNFEEDKGDLFTGLYTDEFVLNQNYEIAHKLITQAAGLGHTKAYYSLAILIYINDLSKNRRSRIDLAEKYISSLENDIQQNNFQAAENSGDVISKEEAQNKIEELTDSMYQKKYAKDFSADIHKHMLVAAKQGYVPAQFALSEIYYNGVGVAPNAIQAYAWAATAVAQNPPFGSLRRDEKAVNLDAVELSEADAIAEEYMKKHTAIFDSSSVTVMR